MASLLYKVSAIDLITCASSAALITVIALLASYIPARVVLRVDPLVALRYDCTGMESEHGISA